MFPSYCNHMFALIKCPTVCTPFSAIVHAWKHLISLPLSRSRRPAPLWMPIACRSPKILNRCPLCFQEGRTCWIETTLWVQSTLDSFVLYGMKSGFGFYVCVFIRIRHSKNTCVEGEIKNHFLFMRRPCPNISLAYVYEPSVFLEVNPDVRLWSYSIH